MQSRPPSILSALPILLLLPLLSACGSDSPVAPTAGIPTDHTEPQALVDAWCAALVQRNPGVYAALLEAEPGGRGNAGFRYRPQSTDRRWLRWMAGAAEWGREKELHLIGNMLDPVWESPYAGMVVASVDMGADVVASTDYPGGVVHVTTDVSALVTWGPDVAVVANVRLLQVLAPDVDGYLRIRSQWESPIPDGRDAGDGIEVLTWARLKGLFHEPWVVPSDFTDPELLLQAWGDALEAGTVDEVAALLEQPPAGRADPGFRYHPQSADVDDFPWLDGSSWDREEELRMIGHMLDPDFVSPQTNEPIESIQTSIVVTSQADIGGGEIEVVTSALFTVLWSAQTGAAAEVRLIHVLAPDPDGFLRIREQRELPPFGPIVENASWGSIKALYR